MSAVQLAQLIQTASTVCQLQDLTDTVEDKREWKKIKDALAGEKERFDKERNAYVDTVLREQPGEDALTTVVAELDDFGDQANASWFPALEYTRENLIPYLAKESKKSPGYRKALKMMPWALGAACVVVYFGFRIFSAVDVSAPLDSKEGMIQRAAAMEKVVRYDDFMHTKVRKGGWLKSMIFWPIEPTDAEMTGASEFAGLSIEALDILRNDGQICGGPAIRQSETLSEEEVKFVGETAEFVTSDRMKWSGEPVLDISVPIRTFYPCDAQ